MRNSLSYFFARKFAKLSQRLQLKVTKNFVNSYNFAVWELTYANPENTKCLIHLLNTTIKDISSVVMAKSALFVNNGKNGTYQVYLAAGFPAYNWEQTSHILNAIPGVTRTFVIYPEMLVALSVQGIFESEENPTVESVDKLYAKIAEYSKKASADSPAKR